ncbi:MAG: cell division protein ZapE [Micrococcales bacterium]
MAIKATTPTSLSGRNPSVSTEELLAQFVPPREFHNAKFGNYIPDPQHPSQAQAVSQCEQFARGARSGSGLFSKKVTSTPGVYLDGGFGVGKTHLLAAIWHEFKGKKVFGSFLAYTGLIGVLGFANAVKQLSKYQLVAIDEFELDDPGDTMMLSRLLTELEAKGVKFAATSNTPPNALGQGRFAAADFAREINAMAGKFQIVTIDGEDYRHRPVDSAPTSISESEMTKWVNEQCESGAQVAVDDFGALLKHLGTIHPSRYLQLLRGIDGLALEGVTLLHDQVAALRFVALVDRLYESQVAIRNTGHSLTSVFSEEMIGGAYRKKYLRAVSRLGALSSR